MEPALRLSTLAPPPGWLTLAEAAQRLGLSPGHARRCAAEEWSVAGTARFHEGAWIIHPTADLRLAGIETHRQRDLRQLAALRTAGARPRDLEIAEARRDIVAGFAAWEAAAPRDRDAVAAYLAHCRASGIIGDAAVIARCSVSTFYSWRAAYERPGDAGGLRALLGRQGRPSGESESVGAAAWAHCRQLLLAGNNIRVATAWTLTRGEATKHPGDPAWTWPALRTIQRKASAEIPRPLRILANKGPRAFDAHCIPKGSRDYDAIGVGDCWIGDEQTFDIMIRVPADRGGWRPCRQLKLTAWMDERSRFVVGWLIAPFANSDTILGSLKRGVARHGLPAALRVDWGRDYRHAVGHAHARRWDLDEFDGARVGSVCDRLGINIQCATPYMPWCKAIESLFRTLHDHFDRLLSSYWGGSPDARHEDRQAWVQANIEKLPTLDDVVALFAQQLDVYHASAHSGAGMMGAAPAEALNRFRVAPPTMLATDILEWEFLSYTDPKLVRRDGVRHLKSWYGWGEPRLIELQGQKIILGLHPDDAGHAWVCDLERTPLFVVESERHKFRDKRDAERIAKTRAATRRMFSDEVRAARAAFHETPPAVRIAQLAAGVAAPSAESPRQIPGTSPNDPPILRINPAISNALRSAAESASNAEPAADPISLDEMLDDDLPDGRGGVAAEPPADGGAANVSAAPLSPEDWLPEFDEEQP